MHTFKADTFVNINEATPILNKIGGRITSQVTQGDDIDPDDLDEVASEVIANYNREQDQYVAVYHGLGGDASGVPYVKMTLHYNKPIMH